MATQDELVSLVQGVIQDDSYSEATILKYLNRAQSHIAGGVMIVYPDGTQAISKPLPDLATSSDITTSTSDPYVDMPDDYSRELYFVSCPDDNKRITIYQSVPEFLSYYPGLSSTSDVIAVCVRGTRFYYQGMPDTAQTLTLYYHKTATDMAGALTTPDGIPEHLQEELLVNHVAWKIFNLIEDGVEGQKINSLNAKNDFMAGMIDLNAICETLPEPVIFEME